MDDLSLIRKNIHLVENEIRISFISHIRNTCLALLMNQCGEGWKWNNNNDEKAECNEVKCIEERLFRYILNTTYWMIGQLLHQCLDRKISAFQLCVVQFYFLRSYLQFIPFLNTLIPQQMSAKQCSWIFPLRIDRKKNWKPLQVILKNTIKFNHCWIKKLKIKRHRPPQNERSLCSSKKAPVQLQSSKFAQNRSPSNTCNLLYCYRTRHKRLFDMIDWNENRK